MIDAVRSTSTPLDAPQTHQAVDNTDWLKTVAIILVAVDHFGFFFMDDDSWWVTFGRMAAPVFFYLMGYARTRTVPLTWIALGVILTLLSSWNSNWRWVAPNILLSLALIRFASPYLQNLLQRFGWIAFALLVCALLAALPLARNLVDYGAEGWLWGLFGLCQRMYVDGRSIADVNAPAESSARPALAKIGNLGLLRLLAWLVAAIAYVWQEQKEFSFSLIQLSIVIVGTVVLSILLCLFRRGPSRIQPPEPVAGVLRFIGRHTLEIYAIQLGGSELLVKFVPSLAP